MHCGFAGPYQGYLVQRLASCGLAIKSSVVPRGALPCVQGSATLESCLDWLCLNLPPSQLPRKFAGSVKGGGAQVRG